MIVLMGCVGVCLCWCALLNVVCCVCFDLCLHSVLLFVCCLFLFVLLLVVPVCCSCCHLCVCYICCLFLVHIPFVLFGFLLHFVSLCFSMWCFHFVVVFPSCAQTQQRETQQQNGN